VERTSAKQAQSTGSAASPPPSSLSPSSPADEASAAAVYELSYFGGITTEEGAPQTAFWDDIQRRLVRAASEGDFPLIEKFVFDHHLLFFSSAQKKLTRSSQRKSSKCQ
jgi:hypothetical protein